MKNAIEKVKICEDIKVIPYKKNTKALTNNVNKTILQIVAEEAADLEKYSTCVRMHDLR